VIICLEQDAINLHMVPQLMPLPPHHLLLQ